MVALQILVLTVGVRILLGELAANAAFCFAKLQRKDSTSFIDFWRRSRQNASRASKIKLVRKNCKVFASFAAFCGTQKCEFHEQSKTRNKKITK